jgi:nucleoside-diphosphate kinase
MSTILGRAALYAGRNYFGRRAALYSASALAAAAAGTTLGLADKKERSFIMLKPDAVQRGLVGEIVQRFEKRGYKLVAMKLIQPSEDLARAHYHDLAERPFYPRLCSYLASGPVIAMVWEGEDIVKQGRAMIGKTSPLASSPGTIRGDLAIVVENNVIHGSDTVENAEAEINLWFGKQGVTSWAQCTESWVY